VLLSPRPHAARDPGTEANAAAALLEARKPGSYFALDYATPWPLFA
jgi:hypothetical protein